VPGIAAGGIAVAVRPVPAAADMPAVADTGPAEGTALGADIAPALDIAQVLDIAQAAFAADTSGPKAARQALPAALHREAAATRRGVETRLALKSTNPPWARRCLLDSAYRLTAAA
jgi:hypothetical protein